MSLEISGEKWGFSGYDFSDYFGHIQQDVLLSEDAQFPVLSENLESPS